MIKRIKLYTATLAMALCMNTNIAGAAPVITNQSLYELTDMVEKEVSWYQTYGKIIGYELELGGEVEVTNNDTFYRVTLPNVSVYIRDLDKYLNIGDIVANMIQTGDNVWKAKASIPNFLTITDENENLDTSISMDGHIFSFIWLPEHKIYPEFRANIDNLQITTEQTHDLFLNIKEIKFKSGLNPNQTRGWAGINKMKSWGGKSLLEISNLKSVINKSFSVKADFVRNHKNYTQLHPLGVANNRVSMKKFVKAKEFDEEEINLLDTFNAFSALLAEAQGTKNNLEINGLDIMRVGYSDEEAEDGELPKSNIKSDSIILDRLKVSSKTTGIEDGLFNSVNRIEFNGLSTTEGFTGEFTPLVPKNGVIPVSARNTSNRTLAKVTLDELFNLTNYNEEPLYKRIFTRMKPMMEDNSSYLSIAKMHLKNGAADMRGSINTRINPHAIYGFSAKANLLFDGYDFLTTNLKVIAGEPHIDLGTLISAFTPNNYVERAIPENFISMGNYKINILESGRIKVRDEGAVSKLFDRDLTPVKRVPRTTWGKTKALFGSLMPKKF